MRGARLHTMQTALSASKRYTHSEKYLASRCSRLQCIFLHLASKMQTSQCILHLDADSVYLRCRIVFFGVYLPASSPRGCHLIVSSCILHLRCRPLPGGQSIVSSAPFIPLSSPFHEAPNQACVIDTPRLKSFMSIFAFGKSSVPN